MDHYVKTDLGMQALKQRTFQLNARQRQLLLLIGTDDFRVLNSAMKQRLATPEIVQQLEQLGLILPNRNMSNTSVEFKPDTPHHVVLDQDIENIKRENKISKVEYKDNKQQNNNHQLADTQIIHHQKKTEATKPQFIQTKDLSNSHDPSVINGTPLNFEEVKQTMMGLLKLHCGLMAKQLILKIQDAQSVREIKLCQMQWITALQETRIPRDELNLNMQRINRSLQHLHTS